MDTAAAMIINVLASSLPFLGKIFAKKKPDLWHEMSWDERKKYVHEGLIAATSAVLAGKALNIDDFMRAIISKVDNSESYADWKRLNRYYITPMLHEATLELEQAKLMKQNGYSFSGTYFKYISPQSVSQLEHLGINKASLLIPGMVLLAFAALYAKKKRNVATTRKNIIAIKKNNTKRFYPKQLTTA